MPETALTGKTGSSELVSETAKVVADIVRLIVHLPFRVQMQAQTEGRAVLLMLTVAPDDLGKIIGKQGRTVRSLRVILSTISSRSGVHFELDVHAERP